MEFCLLPSTHKVRLTGDFWMIATPWLPKVTTNVSNICSNTCWPRNRHSNKILSRDINSFVTEVDEKEPSSFVLMTELAGLLDSSIEQLRLRAICWSSTKFGDEYLRALLWLRSIAAILPTALRSVGSNHTETEQRNEMNEKGRNGERKKERTIERKKERKNDRERERTIEKTLCWDVRQKRFSNEILLLEGRQGDEWYGEMLWKGKSFGAYSYVKGHWEKYSFWKNEKELKWNFRLYVIKCFRRKDDS